MLVFILVYVFPPESESSSEEEEIQTVSIDFLDVNPSIADSIIPKMEDEELIFQHIVWRIPADSNFNLKDLKGGGFIFDGNREFIESLDSNLGLS